MKVAVYKRPNEMAVTDIPKPRAAAGEVVLKVHACGNLRFRSPCGPLLDRRRGTGRPAGPYFHTARREDAASGLRRRFQQYRKRVRR
jgi:hypothetical protein